MVQPILAFVGPKQRARERLVWIGQGHEHERATGPDVETVFFHLEGPIGSWKHGDLLVAVGQVALLKIEAVVAHHPSSDCAEGSVCAKDSVDLHVKGLALMLEVERDPVVVLGVAFATVVKFKPHVGHGLGRLHKDAVESCPRHRVNALTVEAIGLEGAGAVHRVHPSSANRQSDLANKVRHPCDLEGFPSAVAQGQIDASSAVQWSQTRVRASLVHHDLVSAVAQHARPKAAHQARAHHGHLSHVRQWLWPGPDRGPRSDRPRLQCPRSNG